MNSTQKDAFDTAAALQQQFGNVAVGLAALQHLTTFCFSAAAAEDPSVATRLDQLLVLQSACVSAYAREHSLSPDVVAAALLALRDCTPVVRPPARGSDYGPVVERDSQSAD